MKLKPGRNFPPGLFRNPRFQAITIRVFRLSVVSTKQIYRSHLQVSRAEQNIGWTLHRIGVDFSLDWLVMSIGYQNFGFQNV